MKHMSKKLFGVAAGALILAGCSVEAQTNDDVLVKGKTDTHSTAETVEYDFISSDAAKQIAFDHAGVDGTKAIFDDEELEVGDRLYELEFRVDNVEYEYDIDAVTGNILEAERDESKDKKQQNQKQDQKKEENKKDSSSKTEKKQETVSFIGMDKATEIAFNHAGVNAEDVYFDDKELDKSDRLYEFEFYANGVEYEYDIHAVTGEVMKVERDQERKQQPKEQPKQTEQKSQPKAEKKEQPKEEKKESAKQQLLSKDQAIDIALNHAGLSRSQVSFDDVELDNDDGVTLYEIEFESGSYEYEYDIHAYNGDILDHEVEYDD